MLMSALLVGGASTFVSCKDYDGEQAAVSNASIRGLQEELQKQIAVLQQKVRKEKQLNKQVQLNTELKKLKKELEDL